MKEKEKKVKAKNTKKTKETKKKTNYFKAIKSEMSKVVWPKGNEIVKYTIATIGFVVLFVAYFLLLNLLLDLLMSFIKGLFI